MFGAVGVKAARSLRKRGRGGAWGEMGRKQVLWKMFDCLKNGDPEV